MDEIVCFCFGYRMAAPQQAGISFTPGIRKQQPSRMTGKLKCNGLAKSAGTAVSRLVMIHYIGFSRLMRGGSFQPSDMVPRADAKMQIPSCQMRLSAGWPGHSDEQWVRSWTLRAPGKIEAGGRGGFSGASARLMDGKSVGLCGGSSWVHVVSRLLICLIEAEK